MYINILSSGCVYIYSGCIHTSTRVHLYMFTYASTRVHLYMFWIYICKHISMYPSGWVDAYIYVVDACTQTYINIL